MNTPNVNTDAAKKIGKAGMGTLVDATVDIGFAIFDYKSYRADGDSVLEAGLKTGGQLALDVLLPWQVQLPMQLAMAAPAIYTGLKDLSQANNDISSQAYKGAFGGNYSLQTQQAATMRQAGVEAIQRNNMNLRSVLGSEARQYQR